MHFLGSPSVRCINRIEATRRDEEERKEFQTKEGETPNHLFTKGRWPGIHMHIYIHMYTYEETERERERERDRERQHACVFEGLRCEQAKRQGALEIVSESIFELLPLPLLLLLCLF